MKAVRFLCILLLLLFSCNKKQKHPYTFYYWKTKLVLDHDEKKALDKATVPYLYTRFFDVDKSRGKFQPVGVITKDKSFELRQKIVPVVFITNRTFLYIQKEEITFLAQNINDLIQKKTSEYHLNTIPEIQIDCDWTAGTKNDYFNFLKELKKISRKEITCTLRLHQVKDKAQTGIPPVEKVYLMCYSTSSPLENSDKNSILDVNILKSYLADLNDYPLKKIEVALPIYSWGIVTNYLGKHKLINALSEKDLEHPNFKKISNHEIEILKDGFYFGSYMNKGFRIKIESISENQIREVVSFLDKKIPQYNIIYYQLDRKFVNDKNFEL
ncbi:hypothetical protein SAMN05421856_104189 [Chryseobacterium taichungense]|uniref:Lipoprotein n=1 Tax=Chryseobacterium taichungense TaxID=295069 RepID=A0A1H7ZC37_9FLAO|nr:hypothetical protein [Chryseobacterium taichungense]SEM56122.1 hypothetical protein SAMN05421856_104189 [Chryseobacterium taichungense]